MGSISLLGEPNNPHDPNAIGVWFLNDRLGYLQRPVAEKLAPVIDAGTHLTARFVCRNQFAPDSIVGLTVEIIEDGPSK
ncbi:HIRAN domain-containing protein [Desulfosarcina ovata]|uniref:HIRAN domain-containing protein n=1 Tax=Desulfosarcina ovata TaxID=83564 RepID=UPI0012D2EBD5